MMELSNRARKILSAITQEYLATGEAVGSRTVTKRYGVDLSPATVRAELERFGRDHDLEAFVQHENIFLATSEPSPVRVGPGLRPQGDAVVPH
jgi:hypothetical protein